MARRYGGGLFTVLASFLLLVMPYQVMVPDRFYAISIPDSERPTGRGFRSLAGREHLEWHPFYWKIFGQPPIGTQVEVALDLLLAEWLVLGLAAFLVFRPAGPDVWKRSGGS